MVTEKVSEALKELGEIPSETLIEEEKYLEEAKASVLRRNYEESLEQERKKELARVAEVRFRPSGRWASALSAMRNRRPLGFDEMLWLRLHG